MSNKDITDLSHALQAETPKPNAPRKAEAIRLAMKNFDTTQELRVEPRQTPERSKRTGFTGVTDMIRNWKTWGAMGATSTVAVFVGIAYYPVEKAQIAPVPLQTAPVESLSVQRPDTETTPFIEPGIVEPVIIVDDTRRDAFAAQMKSNVPSLMDHNAGSTSLDQSRRQPLIPQPLGQQADSLAGETFANAEQNPVTVTAETPVSTFSIDVDTASYSILRNSLMNWGSLPPKNAVRIEEMVNYFTYDYPTPTEDVPFSVSYEVSTAPWNTDKQLITIGLQGAKPAARVPLNLVFLIDTSGSMNDPKKLPLLRQSVRLLLGQLAPDDDIAIVTYAGDTGVALEPTKADERDTILSALEDLSPSGGTAGAAGLEHAYNLAETMASEGEVTRILLATDGDFNLGISDPDALSDFISEKRETGVYLSVLGFGRGNLNDSTMQALAQNGNGIAAYIDTLGETQKVLVDQMQGALFPIAEDVKIQVEFNPSKIAEYRLLGYETRALLREDFNNDAVDAGEIGAGHQVTAIYEVTPVGSPARLTDPLRYQTETVAGTSDELGYLRLRYKAPGSDKSELIETPLLPRSGPQGFAAAIAGFGELLRGSDMLGDWSYADAIALAQDHKGPDPFGYRQEAIQLMRLAQSLSE